MLITCMDGEISQKLSVRNFKWLEKGDISKFNETFIKNYDKKMIKDTFLK